jgi:hypothetical protein
MQSMQIWDAVDLFPLAGTFAGCWPALCSKLHANFVDVNAQMSRTKTERLDRIETTPLNADLPIEV